jgi:hypothetical protein
MPITVSVTVEVLVRNSAVGNPATPTLIAVKKIISHAKASIIKLSLELTLTIN